MNRRTTLAVALVVLAVPLFAWPIVSPPSDPPDTIVFHTDNATGATVSGTGIEVRYTNLSTAEQRVMNRVIATEGRHEFQEDTDVLEEFNYTDFPSSSYLKRGEKLYVIHTHRVSRGPSLGAVAPRLGALILSIVLGTAGGYLVLSNE